MRNPDRPGSIVRDECVVCPLAAREAAGARRELTERLAGQPGVVDVAALLQAIEARELESSTYLAGGVALPHARTDAVDRLVFAAGTAPGGLPWPASPDVAELVFVVGVPRAFVRDYLELVRRITRAARQPGWVQRAVACQDAPALADWLRKGLEG